MLCMCSARAGDVVPAGVGSGVSASFQLLLLVAALVLKSSCSHPVATFAVAGARACAAQQLTSRNTDTNRSRNALGYFSA